MRRSEGVRQYCWHRPLVTLPAACILQLMWKQEINNWRHGRYMSYLQCSVGVWVGPWRPGVAQQMVVMLAHMAVRGIVYAATTPFHVCIATQVSSCHKQLYV